MYRRFCRLIAGLSIKGPRLPFFGLQSIIARAPESGTATTMIQKASKKMLLGRVQAAVSGYGQLYQTWVAAKAHSAGSSCS